MYVLCMAYVFLSVCRALSYSFVSVLPRAPATILGSILPHFCPKLSLSSLTDTHCRLTFVFMRLPLTLPFLISASLLYSSSLVVWIAGIPIPTDLVRINEKMFFHTASNGTTKGVHRNLRHITDSRLPARIDPEPRENVLASIKTTSSAELPFLSDSNSTDVSLRTL